MKRKLWQKMPRIARKSPNDKPPREFKFGKKRTRKPDAKKIPELNKVLIISPAAFAGIMFLFAFVISREGAALWLGLVVGGISILLAIAAWRVRYRPLKGDDGWAGIVEKKIFRALSDEPKLSKKEQAVQKEASERAAKAGLSMAAKKKRQRLYKRVRDELLENGVSMIIAEDDLATQEQRKEFFEELVLEFSTMESKSLEQHEEGTPTSKERRLRGGDEDYFDRIIKVIEDDESVETGEDEAE